MIVCKIELYPYGDKNFKKSLGYIEIINNSTGTPESGNYDVNILYPPDIEGGVSTNVRKGKINNHKRLDEDIFKLLFKALKACNFN